MESEILEQEADLLERLLRLAKADPSAGLEDIMTNPQAGLPSPRKLTWDRNAQDQYRALNRKLVVLYHFLGGDKEGEEASRSAALLGLNHLPHGLSIPAGVGSGPSLIISIIGGPDSAPEPTLLLMRAVERFLAGELTRVDSSAAVRLADLAVGSSHFKFHFTSVLHGLAANYAQVALTLLVSAVIGVGASWRASEVRQACVPLVQDENFIGLVCSTNDGHVAVLDAERIRSSVEKAAREAPGAFARVAGIQFERHPKHVRPLR